MEKLDDLKTAWQTHSGITQERFEQIGTKARCSADLFRRKIFQRDMAETAGAALGVCFFLPGIFLSENVMERTGFVIVIVGACIIPLVLWWGRKRPVLAASTANFREFVDAEIHFMRRQVWLIRNVVWWYILPCYIGMVVFFLSMRSPYRDTVDDLAIIKYVAVAIATIVMVFIWRVNQSARKKYLEPLLQYYIDMRAGFERDDDALIQLSDAPAEFLYSIQRTPISKRRRRIGIALALACTIAVVGVGYYTMTNFDARTGKFVIGCAPVVGILVIVVTGVWRRNPKAPSNPDL